MGSPLAHFGNQIGILMGIFDRYFNPDYLSLNFFKSQYAIFRGNSLKLLKQTNNLGIQSTTEFEPSKESHIPFNIDVSKKKRLLFMPSCFGKYLRPVKFTKNRILVLGSLKKSLVNARALFHYLWEDNFKLSAVARVVSATPRIRSLNNI
jgi:hypothetical protein